MRVDWCDSCDEMIGDDEPREVYTCSECREKVCEDCAEKKGTEALCPDCAEQN